MTGINFSNLKSLVLVITLFLVIDHPLLSQKDVDYKPPSEWSWAVEDSMEYFIYTPSYLERGKRYPIALYLHGCCGESSQAIPNRTAEPAVRMWYDFESNKQDIPTYIIAPQTTRGWSQHFEKIKKVIDFLVEKRQGDPQRIYIVGFSMGGRGLFQFISKYPEYFAAAIPIGMSFKNGDFEKVKDIPIWANQGENDPWARELPQFIRETRTLNGFESDTASEWVTGVNPRYTSFEGRGHGVPWDATSTQNLTGWAYGKINDGNQYPHVFFQSPAYRQVGKENKPFIVQPKATDPDGSIDSIVLSLNGQYHSTMTKSPFKIDIKPIAGDNLITATAYDNNGKSNTATTVLVVNTIPEIRISELPYGRVGAYYNYWLPATGNGKLSFSCTELPDGLYLLDDGLIRGIPMKEGDFRINVSVKDEDGDVTYATIHLQVVEKRDGEVIVTKARDSKGNELEVSKVVYDVTPNFIQDAKPTSFVERNSFSDPGDYFGLTFVKSEKKDTTSDVEPYMTFEVDRDIEVLVAYEKVDYTRHSTVPEWLEDFQHYSEEGIEAQLRHYDIYAKRFSKGAVVLPGGNKSTHGVGTNYFVMVRSDEFENHPEINTKEVPIGFGNSYYKEHLSSLYGHGKQKWELTKGQLPEGLSLTENGIISGFAQTAGTFLFGVRVLDDRGQSDFKEIEFKIK